jgi:hypothetical protein
VRGDAQARATADKQGLQRGGDDVTVSSRGYRSRANLVVTLPSGVCTTAK